MDSTKHALKCWLNDVERKMSNYIMLKRKSSITRAREKVEISSLEILYGLDSVINKDRVPMELPAAEMVN